MLLLNNDTTTDNDEEVCYKIIANAKLDGWKKGKSQVTSNDVIISESYHTILYI